MKNRTLAMDAATPAKPQNPSAAATIDTNRKTKV
jgi:hypothetical protein